MRYFASNLDVICRSEAILATETHQGPIGIGGVIDFQSRIFRKGDFFVGLPCVIVEGFGMVGDRRLSIHHGQLPVCLLIKSRTIAIC